MREVESDRFAVYADDGTPYTIIKYVMEIPVNSISDSGPPVKGSTRLVLLGSNDSVRRIDDSTFEVVDTKQILRKV